MRRFRSALSIASLWAVIWTPVGVALGLAYRWLHLPPRNSLEALYLISWPLFGALSGSVFSLVFAVAERRRGFDELSARRTTLWGTVGGSTVPVGFIILTRATPGLDLAPMAPTIFAIMAMLGAACGIGMLFLARHGRAPVDVSAPPT